MHNQPGYRTALSVLVTLALLGAITPGSAQTPVAAQPSDSSGALTDQVAGQPKIQFQSMEHDFGQANSGDDLKTTFAFKNVGDAVLVIQKVKGG